MQRYGTGNIKRCIDQKRACVGLYNKMVGTRQSQFEPSYQPSEVDLGLLNLLITAIIIIFIVAFVLVAH